jgi:Cell wall-associated hydrolases (invasion-associated proteins)
MIKNITNKIIIFLFLMVYLIISAVGCGTGSTAVSGEAIQKNVKENTVDGIRIDESTAVIIDTVVDIYGEPDVKSERITQALYNQPVSILEEKDGWCKVITVDGSSGWTRSKFVDRDIKSIYGRNYIHRIIVTSKDKSIYSDYTGGITVKEVVMGTELYVLNSSGTSYEVYLPGNTTGWVRGSGMIHVELNEETPLTSSEDFAASALKFKGTSYLSKGVSSMGIDSTGMTYICSRVNGIKLPRNLKGLEEFGTKIPLEGATSGDLIFLSPSGDEKNIGSVGICIGNGQYIHASKVLGYVRLDGLNESGSEGKPVLARRIFR